MQTHRIVDKKTRCFLLEKGCERTTAFRSDALTFFDFQEAINHIVNKLAVPENWKVVSSIELPYGRFEDLE
jgi:hypothetical protein